MSTSAENDKWIEVLAGRAPADDADTELAASTRDHFLSQMDADLAMPADPAREKRLTNLLEGKGAFKPAAVPAPRASLPRRALAWLFPPDSGHAGRYALVAAVVMAVVIAPSFIPGGSPELGEGATDKGFKGSESPSPKGDLVLTESPQRRAQDLAEALTATGVAVSVEQLGDETLVSGTVPPDKAGAVAPLLSAAGVPPLQGQILRVRFKAPSP